MRPRTLDECVGQEALLGPGGPLRTQIERDDIGSMILWGPPGCGKTTLARIIARVTRSEFISFSAVLTGIKEIKEVMAEAERGSRSGRRTIVFIDEVHRFNKSQQDAFLAARRSRKYYFDWRHHGESFVRGHRAAAFAHARLRPASLERRANSHSPAARADRYGARPRQGKY